MQAIEPLMPWQAWQLGSEYPRWTEHLRDGTQVLVRPVTRTDATAEADFISGLSQEAMRYRFMGSVSPRDPALIAQLTDLDYNQDVAFAAVTRHDGKDLFLGVARYSTSADGTDCECAVTVLDAWQNKGLGVILMRHLIEVAKARGVKHMWSMDSAENMQMTDLARFLGFSCDPDPNDASQVIHSLWL